MNSASNNFSFACWSEATYSKLPWEGHRSWQVQKFPQHTVPRVVRACVFITDNGSKFILAVQRHWKPEGYPSIIAIIQFQILREKLLMQILDAVGYHHCSKRELQSARQYTIEKLIQQKMYSYKDLYEEFDRRSLYYPCSLIFPVTFIHSKITE